MIAAGIYTRNCEEEVTLPLPGKITGEVPKWLNGALYRNGPGRFKFGTDEYQHLFDGTALLQCFFIKNGNITYKSRFLQCKTYKQNLEANRIVMTGFGTKSIFTDYKGFLNKIRLFLKPGDSISDNSLVSIYPFSDELFAFSESPVIHKLNKETLEVEKIVNMFETVGVVNHSAHPHIESDGSVYNLGMKIESGWPVHKIIRFPKFENSGSDLMFGNVEIVGTMESRWNFAPSYMHSFGITPNYFILVQHPMAISILSLARSKWNNNPIVDAFRCYEKENTIISVISRSSGNCVQFFNAKTFFFMHIINQYEEDDKIIIDLCAYDKGSMLQNMYMADLKNMIANVSYGDIFKSQPIRFVLPMRAEKGALVEPQRLCNALCEMPAINYKYYLGKKYRYFYAMNADVSEENPGYIIKVDLMQKTVVKWGDPNCYLSEPVFVPSPNSKKEDDGVILCSMLWDGDENHVGVLILDAKTFTEICRAEFFTPGPVPKCFHGWYMQSS